MFGTGPGSISPLSGPAYIYAFNTTSAITINCIHQLFFLQWLFEPIQGPGLLFSSVIIFHRR
jgi:hypothetical protein